jgi:hypothetical protein
MPKGCWVCDAFVFVARTPQQKTFQVHRASVGDKTSWFDGGKLALGATLQSTTICECFVSH